MGLQSNTSLTMSHPSQSSISYDQNISLSKARRASKKTKRRKKSSKKIKGRKRSQTMQPISPSKLNVMESIPQQSTKLNRSNTEALVAPTFSAPKPPSIGTSFPSKPPSMTISKSFTTTKKSKKKSKAKLYAVKTVLKLKHIDSTQKPQEIIIAVFVSNQCVSTSKLF